LEDPYGPGTDDTLGKAIDVKRNHCFFYGQK